jgi:hypothetical protein
MVPSRETEGPKMLVISVNKTKQRFEFNGTMQKLILELQDHEFPCKVHDTITSRRYKLTLTKESGEVKISPDY